MEYVTRIRDTGFIACVKCNFALLPSTINSHFKNRSHRLDQDIRNSIYYEVQQWPNLIRQNS